VSGRPFNGSVDGCAPQRFDNVDDVATRAATTLSAWSLANVDAIDATKKTVQRNLFMRPLAAVKTINRVAVISHMTALVYGK
jgi:hypothetical protein